MICDWHNKFWVRKLMLAVGVIAACSAASMAANSITGVVRNQTRGQFAIGDDVILLHLGQDMQEEARTRTDLHGAFSLNMRDADKSHLLRVIHHGVNYDQRASAGDTLSINVFDSTAKVEDITGSIEIIRIGTNGNLLHVSDMVEVRNNSSPPLTQAAERTFEVYLPAHARIDSVLAASSGKTGMMISAMPVPDEPGHYAVNFPLRPGATKFAFNYDLPFDERAIFHMKGTYPMQQLAVMFPPTMKFKSGSPAFHVLPTGNSGFRARAAINVKAGERPAFEISGMGKLPALPAQVPSKAPAALSSPSLSVASDSEVRGQSAKALAVASATGSSPFAQMPWWLMVASGLLMIAGCAFLRSRIGRRSSNATTPDLQATELFRHTSARLIEALKNELSQLEGERLQGTVSGEEYESAKQALEGTVKRAMARVAARS